MKKSKVIIKLVVLFVLSIVGNIWIQSFAPNFTNEMAVAQMTNDYYSSTGIGVISYIRNYYWGIPLVIALIMFMGEIKYLVSKVKEKGEKENEEN